jgi:hypothetical protein
MTPSGASFPLFPTINSMARHKDRRGSPLSRSHYIWAFHGPATPIRARFTSPFVVKSASVELLVEKDGNPTRVVGRKGGIYAGNVPPTTARSRNRLSCRRLRRASEAMAAKRGLQSMYPSKRTRPWAGFRTLARDWTGPRSLSEAPPPIELWASKTFHSTKRPPAQPGDDVPPQ